MKGFGMNDESERQKLSAYKSFVRCLSKIDISKKFLKGVKPG
jgi:hypothetical protein